MKECPCEECISFAICYHQHDLSCEDLYRFVCKVYHDSFDGYRKGAGLVINDLYGKWIWNTDYNTWKVKLSQTKHQVRRNHLNDE